jgi:2-methylcitrate dehydratase PrpD
MVAWPALSGLNAALLAQEGFLGPRALFEGDKGFFRMAGSDRYAPELLAGGLGTEFHILRLYFKPYPCCRWIHAALDAVASILDRRGWAGAEVAEVQVGVAREAAEDLDDHAPRNLVDAQFSLPYAVAMLLLGEPPGPGWHRPGLPESAPARAAMAKVRVRVEPGLEALFEDRSVVGAEVLVLGVDGSREQARVERPYGDEDHPMTDADLDAKFRSLAAGILTGPGADRALAWIRDLERLDRAARLGDLLLPTPHLEA